MDIKKSTLTITVPHLYSTSQNGNQQADAFGIEVIITRGAERFHVLTDVISGQTEEPVTKQFEFDLPQATVVGNNNFNRG